MQAWSETYKNLKIILEGGFPARSFKDLKIILEGGSPARSFYQISQDVIYVSHEGLSKVAQRNSAVSRSI